ncbi:DUF4116 domain-containing protein [Vibrio parahaemolyticus]|nr:DUF4116 domain-containing protein [Vibrio parahaemolyticus]ELA7258721.1 DUF4116 domain-containing protein [Vibrio parahaemolyticus]EMF1841577.1 DUF4116 domain-containing protein [Vibrio parahaemolyticus]
MFLAKDFRKGLALSFIKKFRELPNKDRESLLYIEYTCNLNDIINGIYRQEVKVPRHFFLNHGERNIKISRSDGISLYISDRDNDEVVTDAVFFNCKALSFASDRFKSDISIVNIALNNSPAAASCIHEQLKKISLLLKK